jgi:hypothetical protein
MNLKMEVKVIHDEIAIPARSLVMNEIPNPYESGKDAAIKGVARNLNPHVHKVFRAEWERGWLEVNRRRFFSGVTSWLDRYDERSKWV